VKETTMKHLFLLCLLLPAACGTTQTAQTVAASEVALTAAEATAFKYATLPSCPVTTGTLCSQPAIVAQIKAADNIAYAAVKAAEGGTGDAALAAAAVAALVALVPAT
jgi:hypothetical protein